MPLELHPARYYFAKIGKGNRYANRYLNCQGEVRFPAIPIYFDCSHADEATFLSSGGAGDQGQHFFACGRSIEEKYIVVVHAGIVTIARPIGPVVFERSNLEEEPGFVKFLPIEVLRKEPISRVPAILASIGANRYYSSGTFRPIVRPGNIRAVRSVLSLPVDIPDCPTLQHALECLSSVELETLVARLFEEAGCFVPAYRGGYMQDADVIARNRTLHEICLAGLRLGAGDSISIQIKLDASKGPPPQGVDYLLSFAEVFTDKHLGLVWFRAALANSPQTLRWLEDSLDWLPRPFRAATLVQHT